MRIASELSSTNPVPVNVTAGSSAVGGTLTDRSGTITLGGTAQQLAAANTERKYFFILNLSTEDMWINFGTTAVADQPSIKLTSGQSFVFQGSFVSTQLISVIASTTGSKFVSKEG